MISQYLINVIEEEVLPVSFGRAHLPKQLTRAESVRTKLLARRVKAKIRSKYQGQIQRNEVIKEFEEVRNYLRSIVTSDNTVNWRKFEGLDNAAGFRNLSSVGAAYVFTNFAFGDGVPIAKNEKEIQSSRNLQQITPYNVISDKSRIVSFIFDRSVYKLITKDFEFSKTVGIVESASRLFVVSKGLDAAVTLSLQKDVEIPKLEKFILSMNVSKIDFETKMELWDEFDIFVRLQIQERIKQSSVEKKEKLQDFNKRLFTNFPLED